MALKDFYITSNMSLYFIYKYYKNNNLYNIPTKFISFNNKCVNYHQYAVVILSWFCTSILIYLYISKYLLTYIINKRTPHTNAMSPVYKFMTANLRSVVHILCRVF